MRGTSGKEKVSIDGGSSITLTTTAEDFYACKKDITIKFQNDASGRDLYFDSKEDFGITFPNKWGGWKCGSSNENKRCNSVRKGIFAWEGPYYIDF